MNKKTDFECVFIFEKEDSGSDAIGITLLFSLNIQAVPKWIVKLYGKELLNSTTQFSQLLNKRLTKLKKKERTKKVTIQSPSGEIHTSAFTKSSNAVNENSVRVINNNYENQIEDRSRSNTLPVGNSPIKVKK